VFLEEHPADVSQACFGVAGPVREGRTEAVNLAWPVDARSLAGLLGLARAGLVNDLEANALGIDALGPGDLATLNEGDPSAGGNSAVISAGTGLGEAGIYAVAGHRHVFATEGGHADFAPRTELQSDLLQWLSERCEHVSYERVCSGMGLVNVYTFLRERSDEPAPDWLRAEMAEHDAAAAISQAALENRDEVCSQALDVMVSVFGAEAGNLALKVMATGGVYVGGGIAPKILPRLEDGTFMRAFVDKGRLGDLLRTIPVRIILNDETALLGAALCASRQ
jgi:glucokinase